MNKKKWDGTFSESKYIETGNIVNDVIENNGRILHESTPDGYTHEMVDRGEYISDDYYFPQRGAGKKPHIHYEMRTSGEVLIDGKQINTGGEYIMKHGMKLTRNKSLDGTILQKESGDLVDEGTKLHELGEKFESDKAKLENEIEKVQNSKISEVDKKKLINELNVAIELLKEQYDTEVSEEEDRVQEELTEQTEAMQEAADELERHATDFRSVQMEAGKTDASAAADAADAEKEKFNQMKAEYLQKQKLLMEQAAIQRRNMQKRRLTGR